ncbi:MAG: helix-turn-helix domain-containing protein, partial [Actinobacteria bacterium]|nr:helix-turn-helix domain-containing protein [Actinomycetota bacterium]
MVNGAPSPFTNVPSMNGLRLVTRSVMRTPSAVRLPRAAGCSHFSVGHGNLATVPRPGNGAEGGATRTHMPINPSPAVLRAADVLEHLAARPDEAFSVSELAREVGMPRATCDAVLLALAERALVDRRDPDLRYV